MLRRTDKPQGVLQRTQIHGQAAYVFVTQWVSMSFFPDGWFNGDWRKVKKDRNGRVYVCLDEIIEKERKE